MDEQNIGTGTGAGTRTRAVAETGTGTGTGLRTGSGRVEERGIGTRDRAIVVDTMREPGETWA